MMDELVQILRSGNHSLVVAGDGIRTFDGRGISDLYRLLREEPVFLHEAHVADKVVGKAAATLLALAAVGGIYADVISRPAFGLLESAGIQTIYGKIVPHIINRAGTGLCPLEKRCMECKTLEECFVQIRSFMEEMNTDKYKSSEWERHEL